jgi:hypothetical protein
MRFFVQHLLLVSQMVITVHRPIERSHDVAVLHEQSFGLARANGVETASVVTHAVTAGERFLRAVSKSARWPRLVGERGDKGLDESRRHPMPTTTTSTSTSDGRPRRLVAEIVLSLDGRVNGTGADYDMSWIVPRHVRDVAGTGRSAWPARRRPPCSAAGTT